MSYKVTTLITTDKAVANNDSRLSICLRPNGFSFATASTDQVLYTLGEAEFDMTQPLGETVSHIKAFFAEQGVDTLNIAQMRLVVPASQFVWIPEELYDPARDRQYLQMVARPERDNSVCHILSPVLKAYMVFTAPAAAVTAFKVALPGIDIHCQHSVLVNDLTLKKSVGHPCLLVHVREGVADYEAFYDGRLLLSNSLPAADDNECLYHALGIMKQLHMETPDMELTICGDVGRQIYQMLQHYFPSVTLYTGKPHTFVNPEFQTLHTYRHALLLS